MEGGGEGNEKEVEVRALKQNKYQYWRSVDLLHFLQVQHPLGHLHASPQLQGEPSQPLHTQAQQPPAHPSVHLQSSPQLQLAVWEGAALVQATS